MKIDDAELRRLTLRLMDELEEHYRNEEELRLKQKYEHSFDVRNKAKYEKNKNGFFVLKFEPHFTDFKTKTLE